MGKRRAQREEIFAREYLIDLNGTKAAIAAGYSEKGADVRAAELLGTRRVKDLIAKLAEQKLRKLDVSVERILTELSREAFANMFDFLKPTQDGEDLIFDFSKLTREQAAAIQEYTVDATGGTGDGERKRVLRTRFKLTDKIRAQELLGKYQKLFVDRVEITGDAEILAALRAGRERARNAGG